MYSVLNLVFWFWFITIYPEFIYKRHLFSQFQVLRERSSTIASFVEHSVYSISKMYSVLILVFWFWFVTVYPTCMYKSHLFLQFLVRREGSCFIWSWITLYVAIHSACVKVTFLWNSRCSAKEVVISVLLSWSTLHIAFPKCIDFSFLILICRVKLIYKFKLLPE